MKCIICEQPADKVSVYVPGDKTRLIFGTLEDGKVMFVPFGICSSHLDEEGNIPEDTVDQVKKNIFQKIREGNVPRFDNLEDLP